ncbi:MAG: DUF3298 domain-containing protein [Lachnospiraceae bacterium]|nr:DUF3298 domain-containing protein [Lachnospiraceae bacterium]
MKRKISRIKRTGVIILCAALLAGCGSTAPEAPAAPVQEAVEQAEAAAPKMEEVTEQAPEQPETQTEEKTAGGPEWRIVPHPYETDCEWYDARYETVEITDDGHEALKQGVAAFMKETEENFLANAKSQEEEATRENEEILKEQEGEDNGFMGLYYSDELNYEIARADERVFCLVSCYYMYFGGAHGGTVWNGVLFDTRTGERIEQKTFNPLADRVTEYVLACIAASADRAKSMLFEDYKVTILNKFADGVENTSLWLTNGGLSVAFNEYEIAPYASGTIIFEIPYQSLDGFPEEYLPEGEFYTVGIDPSGFATKFDVNGDGKGEYVWLQTVTDQETYFSTYTLNIGNEQFTFDKEETWYCEPNFIHTADGEYFLVSFSGMDDWTTTDLYEAAGDRRLLGSCNGSPALIRDGTVTIHTRTDAFGTWTVEKEYTYGKDGLKTTETSERLNNDPAERGDEARSIKLKKPLSYHRTQGAKDSDGVLDPGTELYPVTAYPDEIEFVTKDGRRAFFTYTTEDYTHYVDGVAEYDLFEELPYAG